MILIPNNGNAGNNIGKRPQCIAHKIDVAMPIPSQFNLIFIVGKVMAFAISLQLSCFLKEKNSNDDYLCTAMINFTKNKKLLIYLGFFGVLLILFYLSIKNEHQFSDAKLAVINPAIPEFSFTDQNGKIMNSQKTEGKVYVADFFFTSCKGICPKMNVNMRRIYEKFKDESDFLVLSHTCMPETDSVNVLKHYESRMLSGELYQINDGTYKLRNNNDSALISDNKKWFFLTGDKAQLYKMARQGYMIDNGKPDSTQRIENQFIHTQFFALVDRYGRVRGIYDGLIEDEVTKLMIDIPELMKEKVDHTRFLNGFSNSPN